MALDFSEAKKVKKDFGRVEDGAYAARIVQIIDFGLQYETDWKTNEVKTYDDGNPMIKHKVWITFELPEETIEIDGENRPRWYGKEYTVSAHEKSALYALLKSVDPKGHATNGGRDVKGLLGLPAMVTIGSTSTGKAKISGVSATPKGLQVGPLSNEEFFFELDSDDVDAFDSLPGWMKERIRLGVGFSNTTISKVLGGQPTASKAVKAPSGTFKQPPKEEPDIGDLSSIY